MLLSERKDVNAGGGGGSSSDNLGWKQAWGLVKPTFVTSGDAIVQVQKDGRICVLLIVSLGEDRLLVCSSFEFTIFPIGL